MALAGGDSRVDSSPNGDSLFATTALVLSAGFAAAEGLTFSGYAQAGFKYNEANTSTKTTTAFTEIEIDLKASVQTDSGLEVGTSMDIDSNSATAQSASVTDHEVYISGAFGTLSFGALDAMTDDVGMSDIGFDGIGVDNVAEENAVQGSASMRWDYSVGDLSVGLSTDIESEDYGLGASYKFGAVKVAAAYSKDESTGVESTVASISGSQGPVSATLLVADNDLSGSSYGVYAAYKMDALTLNAAYTSSDDDAAAYTEDKAFGVGFAYDLGGATLAGGLGQNGNGASVADLGIKFSF